MNEGRHFVLVLLVWVAGGLSGCASTTRITDSWQEPDYPGHDFQKIAVIGLSGDRETRRIMENHVLARLRELGIDGAAGNELFEELPAAEDTDLVRERLEALGADGALSIWIVAREMKKPTPSSSSLWGDPYGYDFYSHYGMFQNRVYEEPTLEPHMTLVLECVLYELGHRGPVAMRQISIDDPNSVEDVEESTRLLITSLREAHIIKRR